VTRRILRNRRGGVVTALAVLCIFAALPASAAEEVDLELILAVDVSGSVDIDESKLLKQGHAKALRDPQVIQAIKGGMLGKIAVTYVAWAGFGHIETIIGWRVIKDKASAHAFADLIEKSQYSAWPRTAISDMILASIPMFKNNQYEGLRRVLDLAGDGANNIGMPVNMARDRAVADGIIINGIPILSGYSDGFQYRTVQYLDTYFEKCVIGGQGSFVVVANGFEDFARAIKRKMILEIAGRQPPQPLPPARAWLWRAQAEFPKPEPMPRIDPHCLIGEERWQNRDWDDL
jgi:hypothetical protein